MASNPFLPDSEALALLAADYPHPILLWTMGHDLVVRSAAGQLLGKFPGLIGHHLLDLPLPKDSRRRALNGILRALRGEVATWDVEGYGDAWRVLAAPIYLEGEVKGIVGQTVRSAVAPSVLDPPQSFLVVRPLAPYQVGDLITIRLQGDRPVQWTTAIPQADFDRLLTAGALMPADAPCVEATPIPARLSGVPPTRLALVR